MIKILASGLVVLAAVGAPSLGYSQTTSERTPLQGLAAADMNALADARVAIVKQTLQLTPDQEKFWPPIEEAIRSRAKGRQSRVATVGARQEERADRSPIEIIRDRNPVEFLNRRSDALTQRAAELKHLAAAWQPLYQTLTPDQRRRLGFVAVYALRELRDAAEQRRIEAADEED